MQTPKFLTVTEALAVMHVSRPTLWRHIKNKTIPATKLGRRVLIPSAALDALEAAAMAGTPAGEGGVA
jgi:excisionase family DNA binding protein